MIRNIAFDFGGVIVDLDREEAVQAFIRLGLENADRILDKYHQTGIFQELEEGKLSEEAYREKLSQLCGRPLEREEVRQAWMGFVSGMDIRKLDYIAQLRQRGEEVRQAWMGFVSGMDIRKLDYIAQLRQRGITPKGLPHLLAQQHQSLLNGLLGTHATIHSAGKQHRRIFRQAVSFIRNGLHETGTGNLPPDDKRCANPPRGNAFHRR